MSDNDKKFFGVYRASVFSNADPNKQRRLQLLVPSILGPTEPTGWAWPSDFSASYSDIPAVGQGVWVMFEQGHPNNPLWVGTFGKHLGKGYQVKMKELPKGSYPATLTRHISGTTFDVVAAIADLAAKVDEIRVALNTYPGGLADAPADIAP